MRRIVHVVGAVGIAAATALAAQALTPGSARLTKQSDFEHAAEPLPVPVTGDALFASTDAEDDTDTTCLPLARILGVFTLDVEAVGGQILILSGGLEQEFANHWRQAVGIAPVEVSQVFAHVVPVEEGNSIVDVVEIDNEGCALSRTLLSHADWISLLRAASGVQV